MNRDIWDYVFRFESYDYVSRLYGAGLWPQVPL